MSYSNTGELTNKSYRDGFREGLKQALSKDYWLNLIKQHLDSKEELHMDSGFPFDMLMKFFNENHIVEYNEDGTKTYDDGISPEFYMEIHPRDFDWGLWFKYNDVLYFGCGSIYHGSIHIKVSMHNK